MKKIVILFLICTFGFIQAESNNKTDSLTIGDKVDQFRDQIKTYREKAPALGFWQKIQIGRTMRGYRSELREHGEKIRTILLEIRRKFGKELTRDQLLIMRDIEADYLLRTPGVKMAVFLQKLEEEDRVELLKLGRKLFQSSELDWEANNEKLFQYLYGKLFPKLVKRLNLSAQQQVAIEKIFEEGRAEIRPLRVEMRNKVKKMRKEVHQKLSEEQKNYMENNRESVFEDMIKFVKNL